MKILYITTISDTMAFFTPHINMLLDQGHIVDMACNDKGNIDQQLINRGCRIFNIEFQRFPLKQKNYYAYQKLKELIKNGHYDIVHCHTPVAALCTRFACRSMRKTGLKVIYTAHGFHFYYGAPIKNWLVYYPAEWLCSHWTDVLITINTEDYALAQKKMKAKKVAYVPGVGIDLQKCSTNKVDKASKRAELGIPENATVILSVGELNKNKNHKVILKALAKLRREDFHYVIAGKGNQFDNLKILSYKLGLQNNVNLLGYRRDVKEIYNAADIFCFPSHREGLSVSLMEAMASGLPCIVSKIRGNIDLIKDGDGGLLCNYEDTASFAEKITLLANDPMTRYKMGRVNIETIKKFDIEGVQKKIYKIYQDEFMLNRYM